jgi:hypothetical protein
MAVARVLERLRQPAHTGEDRCVPCTLVNLAITVMVTLGVLGAVLVSGRSPPVAALTSAVVFGLAIGTIVLRGYLVPGTPWLTQKYLPEWVLRRFDKAPAETSVRSATADGDTAAEPSAVAIERMLRTMGALTDCPNADDVCLTADFRTAWQEEIANIRDRDAAGLVADLAPVLGVDRDEIVVRDWEDAWTAYVADRQVGQWESHAAVLADVAAANELRERGGDHWASQSVIRRGQLLQGLRVFLQHCPACGGVVTVGEETVSSCCRSAAVVAVTCRDCGVRLFETETPG